MSSTIYSYDGEIKINTRKNKKFEVIVLSKDGLRRTTKKRATTINLKHYQEQGLRAWEELLNPTPPKPIIKVPKLKDFYQEAVEYDNQLVKEFTAQEKIRRVELHCLPYLGNMKLDQIRPLDIEQWQFKLIKAKGADQARRTKRLLKTILDRAMVQELIKYNVVIATSKIRGARVKQREIYTKEEMQTILNNSTGQLRLIILTMVSLGLRSGELIAIKKSDINHNNQTIKIQRAIRRGKVSTTKTGVSRVIDIPTPLYEELLPHIKQTTFDYIFPSEKGTHYRDSSTILNRHFIPLLERIGIRYRTMYSLRHTYASISLHEGQTLSYVSHSMGHRDTRVTQEAYIKYIPNTDNTQRANTIFSF